MKKTLIAGLMFLVVLTGAVADEMHGAVSLGYFGDTGSYAAPSLEVLAGDWWLYAEHAPTYDPDFNMLMVRKTISKHLKIGIRYQAPDQWRPMVYWTETLKPTKTSVTVRGMTPGTNGAPERFDLFVSQPVYENLFIFGWEFAQAGKSPDYWLGPKVTTDDGKLSLWWGWNLRGGGEQATIASWQVMKF